MPAAAGKEPFDKSGYVFDLSMLHENSRKERWEYVNAQKTEGVFLEIPDGAR